MASASMTAPIPDATIDSTSFQNPTMELLLVCARTRMRADHVRRLHELVAAGPQWEQVLDLARYHGVLLLLARQLESVCADAIPEAVLVRLRNSVNCSRPHDEQLRSEMGDVARVLSDLEIPVLYLRGPALAAMAYENPSLRRSGDLDLLIRERDRPRVDAVLEQRGYTRTNGRPQSHDYACHFLHPEKRLLLDIHWRLSESRFPVRLPFATLSDRLATIEIDGRPVPTLSPEDTLVTTCVYATQYHWKRLKWLCDVGELVERYREQLDWMQLLDDARRSGTERMVAVGLLSASRLLGSPLPEELVGRLARYRVAGELAAQVESWLMVDDRPKVSPRQEYAFLIRARDRVRERLPLVRGCLRHGVTPNARDLSVVRLPRSLNWLHGVIRPARLLVSYGVPIRLTHLMGF